jgi:hypothetical protein
MYKFLQLSWSGNGRFFSLCFCNIWPLLRMVLYPTHQYLTQSFSLIICRHANSHFEDDDQLQKDMELAHRMALAESNADVMVLKPCIFPIWNNSSCRTRFFSIVRMERFLCITLGESSFCNSHHLRLCIIILFQSRTCDLLINLE